MLIFFVSLITLLTLPAAGSDLDDDERVVFFPTCAVLDEAEQQWVVPIHAWVFEPEVDSKKRQAAMTLFRKTLGLGAEQSALFEPRARAFLVDDERRQSLRVRIAGTTHLLNRTEPSGHSMTEVRVPVSASPSGTDSDRSITYEVILEEDDDRQFVGSARLVSPRGLSVVSDIDDTIKISEVHDHARLLKNTFLEPFRAAPGMAELYQSLEDRGAVFHYVSASPWQLYEPLQKFITDRGFPEGSMHLKQFRWKDSSFFDLFKSADKIKPARLKAIIDRYPERRFVFIGDAGELDPEIYGRLAREHSDQIVAILIRIPRPEMNDPARFARAFAGVPRERWAVFEHPKALAGSPAMGSLDPGGTDDHQP